MRFAGKTLLLVTLGILPAGSVAQTETSAASPIATVRGAFFALSVPDLERSVRWYSETLGLTVIMRAPPHEGSTAVVLQGGGLTVELIHRADAAPLATVAPDRRRNYLVHGIFKVGVFVDDWDALITRLRARNVEIALGPFPARDGQPANLLIRDNDGNYIQFFGR